MKRIDEELSCLRISDELSERTNAENEMMSGKDVTELQKEIEEAMIEEGELLPSEKQVSSEYHCREEREETAEDSEDSFQQISLDEVKRIDEELSKDDYCVIMSEEPSEGTIAENEICSEKDFKVNDQAPQYSPQNLNHIPTQQTAQNPQSQVQMKPLLHNNSSGAIANQPTQNFLLADSLQPKVQTENVALINAPPTVPGALLNTPTVVKDWHQSVPTDLRHNLVQKIVQVIFPTTDISTLQDTREMNVAYAQKVEGRIYCAANSLEEYSQLLAEEMFKMQKERKELKQKRKELAPQQQQVGVGGPNLTPMLGNNAAAAAPTPSPKHQRLNELSNDFRKLMQNGNGSDIIVRVKEKEYKLHKFILTIRSPAFASMVEFVPDIVDIHGFEEDVFSMFIEYLYTGSVVDILQNNVFGLYKIAATYGVTELKEDCLQCIKKTLSKDTFFDAVKMAEKFDEEELGMLISHFCSDNLKDLVKSSRWLTFMQENTKKAYELLSKALSHYGTIDTVIDFTD